ncbi:MAG: heme-binding domain-containing protein [Ignavibacteriales bacterium]|nr:heme-binding domain-containing protein [Ignavibacteriales bacterium]
MNKIKKIILVVIAVFVIIQFIRIDKSNPQTNPTIDIINITNPPSEVKSILKNACYDCHSYETKYPWYAEIAPVSWLLKNHINDGRRHINFSTWGEVSNNEKKLHRLDECVEVVKEREMPMKPYVLMHKEAELTEEQVNLLANWFSAQKDSL